MKDPLSVTSIESLQAAAETLLPDDKFRAFQAMTATITTAEMWARVGILRAARKMVHRCSYSLERQSDCPHASHVKMRPRKTYHGYCLFTCFTYTALDRSSYSAYFPPRSVSLLLHKPPAAVSSRRCKHGASQFRPLRRANPGRCHAQRREANV